MGRFDDIVTRNTRAQRSSRADRSRKLTAAGIALALGLAVVAAAVGIPIGPWSAWSAMRRSQNRAPGGIIVDRRGKSVELSTLWADHRVVMALYPNFDCDECRLGLKLLNGHRDRLDATVIAISFDRGLPADRYKPIPLYGWLEFEVYADPSGKVFDAWRIPPLYGSVPRPAVFIIEPGGRVSYSKICDGMTTCPVISQLVETIQRENRVGR